MSVHRLIPLFVLASGLALPLAAAAQTPPAAPVAPAPAVSGAPMHHGHHHHHESFMRALRGVNLTPAQKQQITAFHDAEKKANLNADEATKHVNAKKMRDQIMGILTPDQKTQLAAEMHHAHAPTPGAPMPDPAASPGSR